MSPRIPDRWMNYKGMGSVVEGTPFVPFKVPLHDVSYLKKYLNLNISFARPRHKIYFFSGKKKLMHQMSFLIISQVKSFLIFRQISRFTFEPRYFPKIP